MRLSFFLCMIGFSLSVFSDMGVTIQPISRDAQPVKKNKEMLAKRKLSTVFKKGALKKNSKLGKPSLTLVSSRGSKGTQEPHTGVLTCGFGPEDLTPATKKIDYKKCQTDLNYVLDRLVQGYYFVEGCPAYQKKAGKKREALGHIAECLTAYTLKNVEQKYTNTFLPSSGREEGQMLYAFEQYILLPAVLKAVATVLDDYRYEASPKDKIVEIETRQKGKKVAFNVTEFLANLLSINVHYIGEGKNQKIDLSHQAKSVLLYLIDTLITPKNFPGTKVFQCGEKAPWIFDKNTLTESPFSALETMYEGLSYIQDACDKNVKEAVLGVLIKGIEKQDFSIASPLSSFLRKHYKKLNSYSSSKKTLVSEGIAAYEKIEKSVGLKEYLLSFLRALPQNKSHIKLTDKKGFKEVVIPAHWEGKNYIKEKTKRTAHEKEVNVKTVLAKVLALNAQNAEEFTLNLLPVFASQLTDTFVPELPKGIQKGILGSPSKLQETDSVTCDVKDKKGTGRFSLIVNDKKCQADPVYGLAAFYRALNFASVCKKGSFKKSFDPVAWGINCFGHASAHIAKKGFEKKRAYQTLAPALEKLQETVSLPSFFASFNKGIRSRKKGAFQVRSVPSLGASQAAKETTFTLYGLVEGIKQQLGRSFGEEQDMVQMLFNPRTEREARSKLEAQEAEDARAVLEVLADKAQAAHSEKIACPGSGKGAIYFNRFACSGNDLETFAGLYNVLRIAGECPSSLQVTKGNLLSKCLTYFKQGVETQKEQNPSFKAFSNLPQGRLRALESQVSLKGFLQELQKALRKVDDRFVVPTKLKRNDKVLMLVCSVNDIQQRMYAEAMRNGIEQPTKEQASQLAFNVIEQYLQGLIAQAIKNHVKGR